MKTELIYFGDFNDSKKGLIRGSIAFVILLLLTSFWFMLTYNSFYRKTFQDVLGGDKIKFSARLIISLLLFYVLICSAIGVQIPSSWREAFVYGGLCCGVVFGTSNLLFVGFFEKYSISTAIIDTLCGILIGGITSVCVYRIAERINAY
jgi:uncharacterized membrane protein